jgi:hypothetical protein
LALVCLQNMSCSETTPSSCIRSAVCFWS